MCILKKIKISKDLFIQEMEQGEEVFIPKDLSQDSLPHSMRFYDSILRCVQTHMSFDRKEHFYNKTKEKFYQDKLWKTGIVQSVINSFGNKG